MNDTVQLKTIKNIPDYLRDLSGRFVAGYSATDSSVHIIAKRDDIEIDVAVYYSDKRDKSSLQGVQIESTWHPNGLEAKYIDKSVLHYATAFYKIRGKRIDIKSKRDLPGNTTQVLSGIKVEATTDRIIFPIAPALAPIAKKLIHNPKKKTRVRIFERTGDSKIYVDFDSDYNTPEKYDEVLELIRKVLILSALGR